MKNVIGIRRSSATRADLIALKLKVGSSLVEAILREDRELRKQELLTYGTTSIVGLCTVTAQKNEVTGGLVVRSRVSSSLEQSLLTYKYKNYSTEELPTLEEVIE